LFIIIHELNKFALGDFDAVVPIIGGVVVRVKIGIEIGDKFELSFIFEFLASDDEMFIDHKNHLEIIECLMFEAGHDIVHVLISPGRDDDG